MDQSQKLALSLSLDWCTIWNNMTYIDHNMHKGTRSVPACRYDLPARSFSSKDLEAAPTSSSGHGSPKRPRAEKLSCLVYDLVVDVLFFIIIIIIVILCLNMFVCLFACFFVCLFTFFNHHLDCGNCWVQASCCFCKNSRHEPSKSSDRGLFGSTNNGYQRSDGPNRDQTGRTKSCPFGKNRGAGLVYHLSSFTCC